MKKSNKNKKIVYNKSNFVAKNKKIVSKIDSNVAETLTKIMRGEIVGSKAAAILDRLLSSGFYD